MEEADGAVSQDGAVGHFGAYLKERKMIRHPCQCFWLSFFVFAFVCLFVFLWVFKIFVILYLV